MQCTNNLKQLWLGCHTRHDALKFFPSSNRQHELCVDLAANHSAVDWGGGIGERNMIGFAPMLLAFIEQTALHDRFMEMMDSADYPAASPRRTPLFVYPNATGADMENSRLWNVRISPYICPSAANSTNTATEPGRISYRCSRGDVMARYDRANGRGIFDPGSARRVSIADIVDGTSNTVLLAECNISPAGGSKKYKEGLAQGLPALPTASDEAFPNPQDCMNTKGPNGDFNVTASSTRLGDAWGAPHTTSSQFFTILPPNSPSCMETNYTFALVSASSRHTGGVNIALADGSVQFISDTVQAINLDLLSGTDPVTNANAYATRTTGTSRHGVWGALGSANGGESATF